MEIPDLNRIVDTFIPISDLNMDAYLVQLRQQVIPHIRKLQQEDKLRWYSFLIHGSDMLGGRTPPMDRNLYIHLRLEPKPEVDIDAFIAQLPDHFRQPQLCPLKEIAGINASIIRDQDWAIAWKIHGEASEWVVTLLEGHANNPVPIQQIIQFMHFITTPLLLGHKCICIPGGFLQF